MKKIVYHLVKRKKYLKKLVSEKIDKIRKLQDSVCFNSLPYNWKNYTKDVNVGDFIDETPLSRDIKSKRKKVADEEKKQIDFTSEMDGIKMRGNKSRKQNTKTKNITNLCDTWDKANHFFKDYTTIIILLDMTKTWKRLKILTPKQMLQRKPIALA